MSLASASQMSSFRSKGKAAIQMRLKIRRKVNKAASIMLVGAINK